MPPICWRPERRSCSPATTTSCRPTSTSTSRSAGWTTRCSARKCARPSGASSPKAGPMPCARSIRASAIYTFWDYFRNVYGRDAGLRIDHLLLSPSIAPRLKSAERRPPVRGWEKASDHAPAWIELVEKAKRSKTLTGSSGSPSTSAAGALLPVAMAISSASLSSSTWRATSWWTVCGRPAVAAIEDRRGGADPGCRRRRAIAHHRRRKF